jgi:hypothetical protein
VLYCFIPSTLKMEATRSYETSVYNKATRRHIQEDGIALLYGDGVYFLWGTNWTVSTATSSQYLTVNCEPIV